MGRLKSIRIFRLVALIVTFAVTLVAFQNCAKTSFGPGTLAAGQNAAAGAGPDAGAALPGVPQAQTAIVVGQDPMCGNKVLVGGSCVDYTCQRVIEIQADMLDSVPARSGEGECFVYKVFSGIANSPSGNTATRDGDILARDHDNSGQNNHPYEMGVIQMTVRLLGPRVVKLAGGVSADAPILVDNFVLMGVHPVNRPVQIAQDYSVSGTSDAATLGMNGVSTGTINFQGVNLPVQAYASGGTSSVAPIDLSASILPGEVNALDVRALDCGGVRVMSDVYILFQ